MARINGTELMGLNPNSGCFLQGEAEQEHLEKGLGA